MIKDFIRTLSQKIVGYKKYLFLFSLFTIRRIRSGSHEKEFTFFMGLLPEEGTILDIGANIGIMTVSIARKFTRARVVAFEPIPNNIEALEKVVKHYKLTNVTVFKTALGEQAGELKMILPVVNNSKMQGLSHVVEDGNTGEKGMVYTVPVQKLDDIPSLQAAARITGIKIDVENFEYYVLKGGETLLRKHMPIIYCELWDNDRRKLCMDYLTGLGYAIHIYDGKGLVPFTGQPVINFFFIAGKN
ncbi:MAG: FkbM family methyltransferase [Chitinophagaceae bacterium]